MVRTDGTLVVGAVAYDAKVVTIWEGFRDWFIRHGLAFDYVLYSNYERQVEGLVGGEVDVAWNSPLAWIRAERRARALGMRVEAVAMRDSDCDLTSVVVVRAGSGIQTVDDLSGRTVAVGAVDSPQATLIPLAHLHAAGLDAAFEVRYHDIGVGKHGDHIGGEREAALAMMAGEADAACMIDGNHLLFSHEGTFSPGATEVLCQTPTYDHCNFTATGSVPPELVARFQELLLGMTYDDPEVRPLLDMEGLKQWRPGRTTGYAQLAAAADRFGFYNEEGDVTAAGYRP